MDTIAAISTATGNGGIGIIRMSGDKCFEILEKIFVTGKKTRIAIDKIEGYTIKYGYILDNEKGDIIDEVLVSFFKNPKSYTREDMCEINSHGGTVVEKKILEICVRNGAVLAEPGEFTKRAFLNGRIDLSQAESIIDIINSKSEKEAKASVNQLQGFLSENINNIREKLLDIMADIEANIDYPEYDIEEVSNKRALELLKSVKEDLIKLEESFNTGKILKEGIKTAIVGKPNVGKSSLLNTILKEERAIVSDVEGTTRDTIEEMVNIKGIPLKIIDTAGIRKTNDKIEEIGVEKALKVVENADLVLTILDNTQELSDEDYKILDLIKDKNAIILLNKTDIDSEKLEKNQKIKELNKKVIKISAKNRSGIEDLYEEIENMFNIKEIDIDNGNLITNIRHKTQITNAINSINESINNVEMNLPIDIISISIKQALEDLGKITGDNVSEDIINEIFSKFCLGK